MVKKLTLSITVALAVFLLTLQLRGYIQLPATIDIAGVFRLQVYSLCLLAALAVAVSAGRSIAPKHLWEKAPPVDFLLYMLVPGVIGARIYHVITDYNLYSEDFWSIFYVWQGGLGIIGGIIGGSLGAYFYSRQMRISFAPVVGVLAVVMPLAQAVGRLGNFLNQELYGFPTSLPWGMYVQAQNRLPDYIGFEYFHPIFLYEALANLVLCGILYYFYKRKWNGYRLAFYYVLGYGTIRFILDFMRLEGVSGFFGLTYAQWLILGLLLAAGLFGSGYQLWYKHKYGKWFTKVDKQ